MSLCEPAYTHTYTHKHTHFVEVYMTLPILVSHDSPSPAARMSSICHSGDILPALTATAVYTLKNSLQMKPS